jgi:hypothetical protein
LGVGKAGHDTHEPTLRLYRVKAGLRGFQGAMFQSVRLVYLD